MQTQLRTSEIESAKAYGFLPEKIQGDRAAWIEARVKQGKSVGEWNQVLRVYGGPQHPEMPRWDFWNTLDYFSEGGMDFLVVGDGFIAFPSVAREMQQTLKDFSEKKIKSVRDFSKEVGEQPYLLNLYGKILSFQANYSLAGECFRKAVEKMSEFAEPYANLGVLLWNGGKRREALFLFSEAFMKNPRRTAVQLNFFDAVHEMKEYDYLVQVLNIILPEHDCVEFRLHLAIGYRHLGRLEEARKLLDNVLKQNPQDEEAKVLLLSLDQPVTATEQTMPL